MEQLKMLYINYRWTRLVIMIGLLGAATLLLILEGGFPASTWRFLFHVLSQLPQLWKTRGPALLLPLGALLLQSLSLFLLWCVITTLIVKVLLQSWRDISSHQHFEQEFQEAAWIAEQKFGQESDQYSNPLVNEEDMYSDEEEYEQEESFAPPAFFYEQSTEQISEPRSRSQLSARSYPASTSMAYPPAASTRSSLSMAQPVLPPQSVSFAPDYENTKTQELSTPSHIATTKQTSNYPFPLSSSSQAATRPSLESFNAGNLAPAPNAHRAHIEEPSDYPVTANSSIVPARPQPYTRSSTPIQPSPLRKQLRLVPPPVPAIEDEDEDELVEETVISLDTQSMPGTLEASEISDYSDYNEDKDEIEEVDTDEPQFADELWLLDASLQSNRSTQPLKKSAAAQADATNEDITAQETRPERHPSVPPRASAQSSNVATQPLKPRVTTSKPAIGQGDTVPGRLYQNAAYVEPVFEEENAVDEPDGTPRLIFGIGLDPGIARKYSPNEDSLFAIQGMRITSQGTVPAGLFAIADGMGGHANGREASQTAVNTLSEVIVPALLRETGEEDPDDAEQFLLDLLCDGVHRANLTLYQRNRGRDDMMGTTITTALVVNTTAYILNVGDSRTYHYRQADGLMQITHDHSLVGDLVARGELTREAVYTHPQRNQIYRALGERAAVKMDTYKVDLEPDDLLILCSDGIWEMVRDEEIEEIIVSSSYQPSQISSQLVQAALHNGGVDNISVIVASIVQSPE